MNRDDKVWLMEPKDKLYQWIKMLLQLLARSETLFIIDDIIADESLDKPRQSLSEFVSQVGIITIIQSYSAIPKNMRRQVKAIFVWYPKERADLKMIHDENNVLTDDELVIVRDSLSTSKHTCLYIRNEYPS